MFLRILLLLIVAVVLFRIFGGKVPFLDKREKESKEEDDFGQIETTSQCATCGTYMTQGDALIYQKKAYCSVECLEKAKS